MDFKIPSALPQDLLFIRDLVEPAEPAKPQSLTQDNSDDDISSSSSETDSEEEVVKDLIVDGEDNDADDGKTIPDTSSSSSSDSETGSDIEDETKQGPPVKQPAPPAEFDDDEELATNQSSLPQTKNEIVDADISIPDIEEVGADEELEKVGEILSIMDNVVIVRGQPSEVANRGSERALDSDTLLVFGDRKVMGYIYETFGPTSQPLYQIKFNQNYPLNPEKVVVSREVFHVPRRSHFVFINQLKHLRGSDASNVHDEEPAEDELEFSDDEAEAAYRSRLKRKRAGSRARSVSSSRPPTPAPSQMRDQDMMHESFLNNSAFDEHGPYDSDYGAGPSRPAPKPYDDPYSDAYNMIKPESDVLASTASLSRTDRPKPPASRGRGHHHNRGRGRGRRSSSGVHETTARDNGYTRPTSDSVADRAFSETYDPRTSQLPTFGSHQEQGRHPFNFAQSSVNIDTRNAWDHPNSQYGQFPNQQAYVYPGSSAYQLPYAGSSMFVQPHINPRFASAFGMAMAPNPSTFPSGYNASQRADGMSLQSHDWTEQFTVPVADSNPKKEPSNPSNDTT